jgi:hypothetical protein
MEIPKWLTEKVEAIGDHLRLGYAGGDTIHILSLARPRKLKELPIPVAEWNNRGPVFGTKFDRLGYSPVIVADVSADLLFNDLGEVLALLKHSGRTLRERAIEDGLAEGAAYEDAVSNLAGEMGEYLYHRATRTGAFGSVAVPRKHLSDHEKQVLSGDARLNLRDSMLPGWVR